MFSLDRAARATRGALLGATILSGVYAPAALAQSTPLPPLTTTPATPAAGQDNGATQGSAAADSEVGAQLGASPGAATSADDIVVTGYRNSLALSTNAKR